MNGTEQIATRLVNAENSFIEEVCEQFDKTEAEAEKILAVFLKLKVAKLDIGIGRVQLKHGALWDIEVMNNTLAMEK